MTTTSYLSRRGRERGWWGIGNRTPGNVFVPRISLAQVSFDNPPKTLKTGPDSLQQWRVKVRRSAFGYPQPDPVIRVDLLEDGVVRETPIPETIVSDEHSIVLEGSWDAVVLPSSDGNDVEALLSSKNSSGETRVEIAALQWQPIMTSSVSPHLFVKWTTRSSVSAPLDIRWTVVPELLTLGNDSEGFWYDFSHIVSSAGNDTNGFWIDVSQPGSMSGNDSAGFWFDSELILSLPPSATLAPSATLTPH